MQFNERLKKLRQERGVTQKELAEAVYVSRSAVAKWESGLGLPNAESLKLLAQFFQVEERTLLADPTVETVIVGKNGVMMRQKQIIFGLLAIFIVILTITISVFAATRRDDSHKIESTPTISPIVSRELIFETEKDMDVSDFPVHTMGAWRPSDYFAPSRTFEVGWNHKYVNLPKIYIREKREDGSVTYKSDLTPKVMENFQISRIFSATDTTFQSMSLFDSESRCYNSILLTVYTYNEFPEFENCFNISFEDLTMSVKIFKDTLSHESVEIVPDDGLFEVGLASSKHFSIEKSEAYGGINNDESAVVTTIELPDKTFLAYDDPSHYDVLSSYAYIGYDTDKPYSPENNIMLCTSDKIPLGSKITVEASFDYGRVKTTVVFEVVRVPVTSAKILLNGVSQDESNSLVVGESYNCTIQALPENATFNVLQEDFELFTNHPELASIERTAKDWIVTTCSDPRAVGESVSLSADFPEGISFSDEWIIEGIPVDGVEIVHAETGEAIKNEETVYRGESISMRAKIRPENATYIYTEFKHYSSGVEQYFTLSADGDLTIAEDAPSGMKIDVIFSIYSSKKLIFQTSRTFIVEVLLERVELSAETLYLERGQIKKEAYKEYYNLFTVRYFPEDSTVHQQRFDLLDQVRGVAFYWDGRLKVGCYTEDYAQFRVQATVNGVKSNILTFTVIPPPEPESFTIDVGTDEVERGRQYVFSIEAKPLGAEVKDVLIHLLEEIEGVYIIEGKYLFIAPNVESGTVIRIQATVGEIESNILELTVI